MRNTNLVDETKWLPFRDSAHRDALLCLLAKARIDTADDLFVPLYLLAAAGPHAERYVTPAAVDFRGLVEASIRMAPSVTALIRLAEALAEPRAEIDIREVFASLEETPDFEVAVQAMRMNWEI